METKLLNPSSHALFSTLSSTHHRKASNFFPNTRKSCTFVPLRSILPFQLQASASSIGMERMKRVDESDNLTLENIRSSLIRQEDSIIYGLLERSQYCYNAKTYDPDAFPLDGFHGSLVEYMLRETERLHATIGRYESPDEHPFFPDGLPEPVLPPMQYPKVLHPIAESININKKVWDMYFRDIIPRLVKDGNDGNYGSTAVCDTSCLQVLSRRIHYGKFVAEAKFRATPDDYKEAIKAQDSGKLMELLTYSKVEEAIMKRVEVKALTFGQEITVIREGHEDEPAYKIDATLVAKLYGEWIMPLTKEVQLKKYREAEAMARSVSGRVAAVVTVVLMVVMVPEVCATKWTVGGNKFWNPNINYTIWAEGKHFYNGDWLYFVYDRNQNNVIEVNKTDYETCNSDHPLKNWTRGAGRDVVPLNETRHYYLISGKGFCYSGMKLSVRVENPPPPPSSSPVKEKSAAPSPYTSLRGQYVLPTVLIIGAMWDAFVHFW
ncbi:chorismate mutase 1 [Euphorbia peplus]|nr:chorismate mutase 1 [Euphorbia peplus]